MDLFDKENIAFKITLYFICSIIFGLFIFTILEYTGNKSIYLLFTVVSNTLLFYGFRKNAIMFDAFVGVFFWLGFWVKLSIRVAFMDGQFRESVGHFDGTGGAFDYALLVSSCGFSGLIVASYIREKFIFVYPERITDENTKGLFRFYQDNRKYILTGFIILFVFVAISNTYYGIYQRGTIPRTILPFGLSGIYKWLLLFGGASISALILKYEFTLNKKTTYTVAIICLLESFLSNVSLLSRGMILNTSALVYGVIKSTNIYNIKSSVKYLITSLLIFLILFISSVLIVNYARSSGFMKIFVGDNITMDKIHKNNIQSFRENWKSNKRTTELLFIDRWVGVEGMMAISSYPDRGWGLWGEAWREKIIYNKLSFYDKNIIESPYLNTDLSKHHYISLPGIIAFCFYPGSFIFLFICTFTLGIIATIIEISAYKLGGKNIILCALLAQVVAYRYAHFGYAPKQSYLIFCALYLNLIIIYLSNKILSYRYDKEVLV